MNSTDLEHLRTAIEVAQHARAQGLPRGNKLHVTKEKNMAHPEIIFSWVSLY